MKNLIEQMVENLERWEALIKQAQTELDNAGVESVADSDSRTVVHDDRYIYILTKNHNVVERVSYTPDLFLFLADCHSCSFNCRKAAKYRVYVDLLYFKRAKIRCSPSLSFLVYYYFESGLSAERYVLSVPKLMAQKRKLGLEIDHVNSHYHDHCWWNLAEMSETENKIKSKIVARVKPPYYCIPISTPDGGYRIECGWVMPYVKNGAPCLTGQKYFVSCKDTTTLIAFLKSFVAHCKKVNKTEMEDYFAGAFEVASRAAEKLIVMNDEEFYRWDIDSEWKQISPIQVII